jgi:hypothetical protein
MSQVEEVEKIRAYLQDRCLGFANPRAVNSLIGSGVRMQPGELQPTWEKISKEGYDAFVREVKMNSTDEIRFKNIVKTCQDSFEHQLRKKGDIIAAEAYKKGCAWINDTKPAAQEITPNTAQSVQANEPGGYPVLTLENADSTCIASCLHSCFPSMFPSDECVKIVNLMKEECFIVIANSKMTSYEIIKDSSEKFSLSIDVVAGTMQPSGESNTHIENKPIENKDPSQIICMPPSGTLSSVNLDRNCSNERVGYVTVSRTLTCKSEHVQNLKVRGGQTIKIMNSNQSESRC